MTDYKRMYTVLCKAIDDVIEPLENIREAKQIAEALKAALLEAEDIYISAAPFTEEE